MQTEPNSSANEAAAPTGTPELVTDATEAAGALPNELASLVEPAPHDGSLAGYAEAYWPAAAVTLGLVAAAFVIQRIAWRVLSKLARKSKLIGGDEPLAATRRSAGLLVVLLTLRIVTPALSGLARDELVLDLFHVATALTATWGLIRLLGGFDDVVLRRYDITAQDNRVARRAHTRIRVITRSLMILVGVVGVAIALMTFEAVEQIGVSLLASAGIAGLAIGLAARPTLENLFAGIQIALTNPISLDDVVIVAGEWGRIEEITSTYVVVKIWDKRRLIVPFSKFLSEPFENWTRESSDILGSVFIYTDYTVPVDDMREALKKAAEESGLWDGDLALLQVVDTTETTVKLRALLSARDSPEAWDLRCAVRESLITWLQTNHPESLPRTRVELPPEPLENASGRAEESDG